MITFSVPCACGATVVRLSESANIVKRVIDAMGEDVDSVYSSNYKGLCPDCRSAFYIMEMYRDHRRWGTY